MDIVDRHYTKRELAEFQRRRMDDIMRDGLIRSIRCPFCHAGIGEDCHTAGWWLSKPHAARKALVGV